MKQKLTGGVSTLVFSCGFLGFNSVQAATRAYTNAVPDSLHFPNVVRSEIKAGAISIGVITLMGRRAIKVKRLERQM